MRKLLNKWYNWNISGRKKFNFDQNQKKIIIKLFEIVRNVSVADFACDSYRHCEVLFGESSTFLRKVIGISFAAYAHWVVWMKPNVRHSLYTAELNVALNQQLWRRNNIYTFLSSETVYSRIWFWIHIEAYSFSQSMLLE